MMVTDEQVRRLMKKVQTEKSLAVAAAKSGMDEKTARRYRRSGKLPSACRPEHTWRTREDPFAGVWDRIVGYLTNEPGLEAKTIFDALQRESPGKYQDGQLRTLQRRVKIWRALSGPGKEVFFPQQYQPGRLSESDFTHMSSLGVTIGGQPFPHLVYHFVLPYSNWETGTICFSESFESLSEGFQDALWELGGVPLGHRTDRLSTAVHRMDHPEEFTRRYRALLDHYDLEGQKIQAGRPNENGDVEQSHHRFKRMVDQALMLRGSRDFADRGSYASFLAGLYRRANAGRRERFEEEVAVLRRLPDRRLDAMKRVEVRVGPGSTIRVDHNVYSVHSRLIGERVEARLFVEELEIWFAQRRIERLPRLRGEGKYRIDYRHIIGWLVRKPGAFENYRYREALFPTSRFRMAFDALGGGRNGTREYLAILELAANESESGVDEALRGLIQEGQPIRAESVEARIRSGYRPAPATDVLIADVDLGQYDTLLGVN